VADTSDTHISELTPFAVLAAALLDSVDTALPTMRTISDAEAARPLAASKWCRKEIVGHLIDSAANNHHRFVRAQESPNLVFPEYAQEHWVRSQRYGERDWIDLIALWESYNRHLAHVIEYIPEHRRTTACVIGAEPSATLGFLVYDYIAHLQHHLTQV
jgi:hypothetical protein